ncbi:EamA family transporter [Paenibacillus sp. FSL R7-269]|uniref:EamA family transporter n=1 Tax=Paenibacillus sp. FSL R7-269 TaxID=1226755 RepID=UPI001F2C2D4F|nr:EamA family transporter [Paenibacillus sp. FSL R7-269]
MAIIKQDVVLIVLFILMTLFGAFGGYAFKRLSAYKPGINKGFLLFFLSGGMLYFLGAISNIILLRNLPYTILYPLSSVTYIWTILISYFLLSEKVSRKKILGITLIIVGAAFLIK